MKRQLVIISLLTIASQLAAFAKLWFTARILGVGPEMDGYNLSIVFPTMIAGVAAGVLQTGLFPVRAKLNVAASVSDVLAFERSVLLGMAVLGGAVSLLLVITSPIMVDALAASASASVRSSLAFAYPFAAALVMLNFVGDSCGYLLAMRDRFAIAAAAPVANGVLGAFLLAAWPEGGLFNLVVGTVLGLTLQVCICFWGLKLTGFTFFGDLPVWKNTKESWQEMLSLGGWILPGVVVSNLVVSLPPLWAVQYGEGAVSAFGYAYRLHSAALQLLVIACSTLILARFSDLIARNDTVAVRAILIKATFFSAAIGIFYASAVWVAGTASLEWLFSGRFDGDAAARVSFHWLLLSIGLPFFMLGNVFAKLFQAQRKPMMMSVLAISSLCVLYLAYLLLSPQLEEFSIAMAITLASFFSLLIGFLVLRYSKFTKS
ncbi:lipid II flippase MurJ [Ectopseudomonas guguanensis]|uniref:lipid II flippase MurJ n=1 Tax=Ectopseudomonas guguanensis TaxID=1198456 RepID=UPI003264F7EC